MKRKMMDASSSLAGRRRRLSLALLGVLMLASGAGCEDKARVLANVNGKAVTQPEFDAYLDFKRIPANDEKRREKALDEYLEREGLSKVIEGQKVLDQAAIEAELNEFRKEMVINRYFDEFLREKVTDEAVKSYYETHAKNYEERKVHVAHILVRTHKRMTEEERKAKLTTAQEIYSKIQSGGDFAELAKQFSEDKISGSRGGDLGWIKEGSIDARFSQRAFETKAGVVAEPFETPFGFHVLKVLEEPKSIRRPFAAVAGDIRYQLRNEAKEAELKRLREAVQVSKEKPYELDQKRLEEQKSKAQRSDAGKSDSNGAHKASLSSALPAGSEPSESEDMLAPASGTGPRPAAPQPPAPSQKPSAPQPIAPAATQVAPKAPAPQQVPAPAPKAPAAPGTSPSPVPAAAPTTPAPANP